ncbi:MAG: hypothetical protein JO249_27070 [Acidobacteria bacterium]|nr:hypothetical protein [Acidobacteriota bacterium]
MAKMHSLVFVPALALSLVSSAQVPTLQVPARLIAGQAFTIPTHGQGEKTFYLLGPGSVVKRTVELGTEVKVTGAEIAAAGRYLALSCGSDGCSGTDFFVLPGDAVKISFLLHPSRVPVTAHNAINATAFVFDQFHNPVLRPVTVDFRVLPKNGPAFTKSVKTVQGVAWSEMSPAAKEGPVKVIATVGEQEEPRVIQQVASEACNLRIKARRTSKGVEVETDPVRDCHGNAVPDGTIVSVTAVDAQGRTTVDAPVKKGIARTQLPIHGSATISVASGVAIGNEIKL